MKIKYADEKEIELPSSAFISDEERLIQEETAALLKTFKRESMASIVALGREWSGGMASAQAARDKREMSLKSNLTKMFFDDASGDSVELVISQDKLNYDSGGRYQPDQVEKIAIAIGLSYESARAKYKAAIKALSVSQE